MARNEKTSARVAGIAQRILQNPLSATARLISDRLPHRS